MLREAVGLLIGLLPVEDRARAGGAAAFAEFRPLFGDRVRPVEEGRHGGRELDEAGVVAALVQRGLRIEERADLLGRVVIFRVREVVADEERIAVVAGLLRLVDLVIAAGAARAVDARVGADFAPVDVTGLRVDAQAPRIARAHREDLGAGLRGAGLEEVAFRDAVGRVIMHADAVHLADEGVGVGGSTLSVPRLLARALVERGVTLAVAERAGVVAGREIKAAVGAELQRRAVVAALQALFFVFQDELLAAGDELVVLHLEAGEILAFETDGRIDQVDPAVLRELRVEGEGEEAVLLRLEDLHLRHELHALGLRVVDLEGAAVFVEPEATVRGELEVHRLRQAGEQRLGLETHVLRQAVGGTGGRRGGQQGGAEEGKEADRGGSHGRVTLERRWGSRRVGKIGPRASGQRATLRVSSMEYRV